MTETTYLVHHGVKGMKWGVRRTPAQLGYNDSDTKVTKGVKKDYNTLSKKEFRQKYKTSKRTYAKRVEKSATGDPFRDRRAKMQKSAVGQAMFDVSAKAEANQRVNERLNKKAAAIDAKRSTGRKIVNRILLGQASQSYDRLVASGVSKRGAAAVTVLLGGRAADNIAANRYRNSSAGKRTYSKTMRDYYDD